MSKLFQVIDIKTHSRTEIISITSHIQSVVKNSHVSDGFCLVYIPHTTAGVTINEDADPSVKSDILKELNKVIPFNDNYSHLEGNAAAHIKSSLVGSSVNVIIRNNNLNLGTWQGIFFCEFDGPRNRQVIVQILKES
ncbi:MAG: YjbQ family protein [Spirochaetes bacterium]|nr:YjbQ family protein [Spirochaetota bacterium]